MLTWEEIYGQLKNANKIALISSDSEKTARIIDTHLPIYCALIDISSSYYYAVRKEKDFLALGFGGRAGLLEIGATDKINEPRFACAEIRTCADR